MLGAEIKVGTPQLFDLGVMLVVIGMTVTYLLRLTEASEQRSSEAVRRRKADGRRWTHDRRDVGGAGRRALRHRRHGSSWQRGQIKLVLGLGLISHGVNLALFGTRRADPRRARRHPA
jgi:hypothetical protein